MIKNTILGFITIAASFTLVAAVSFADSMETHTMLSMVTVSAAWLLLFVKVNEI